MRPNFKVVFMKKVVCSSHEQCTRPTKKKSTVEKRKTRFLKCH